MKKFAFAVFCLVLATLSVACDRRPPTTLHDMLAVGDYDVYNPGITEKNFPVKPELFAAQGGMLFFQFMTTASTMEAVAAIRAGGYEPATLEQLLAYGAEYPDEQREGPIFALGSAWVSPAGFRHVPFLYANAAGIRYVSMEMEGPCWHWYKNCRLLAFPRVRH